MHNMSKPEATVTKGNQQRTESKATVGTDLLKLDSGGLENHRLSFLRLRFMFVAGRGAT